MEYATSIREGRKIACEELKQAVERFFSDLENEEYWMDYKAAEFCIQIIEKTICHQQGERLDGTPLRGTPFLLEPFHKFIIYNLVGFKLKGTEIVRFHEALIFIPRKNIKTSFGMGTLLAVQKKRIKVLYCFRGVDAVIGEFQFFKVQHQQDGRKQQRWWIRQGN